MHSDLMANRALLLHTKALVSTKHYTARSPSKQLAQFGGDQRAPFQSIHSTGPPLVGKLHTKINLRQGLQSKAGMFRSLQQNHRVAQAEPAAHKGGSGGMRTWQVPQVAYGAVHAHRPS